MNLRTNASAVPYHRHDGSWEPTPENIVDVADHATRTVLRGWHSDDDRDDARQTAILEIWHTYQRLGRKDRGYFFNVARYAICDWLKARGKAEHHVPLESLEWCLAISETEGDSLIIDAETIRSCAANLALRERDVEYLIYRLTGYGPTAIAREMHVTVRAVSGIRVRLIARLRRIAAEQGERR